LCISLASGIATCLISLFIPSPIEKGEPRNLWRSLQIQSQVEVQESTTTIVQETSYEQNLGKEQEEGGKDDPPLIPKETSPTFSFNDHWNKFRDNYNTPLVIWSIWSGMCIAVHMLVLTYWQSVMYEINPKVNYNGYVLTVAYAMAAAVTLIPTKIEPFLNRISDWLLALLPILYGTCLLLLSFETIIYLAYIWLILYHSLFEFMLAVSSVQIARRTGKSKQFGIVFSLSMVVALLFQNFLQLLVGKQALNFAPTLQYRFFAFAFFGISATCLAGKVWLFLKRKV